VPPPTIPQFQFIHFCTFGYSSFPPVLFPQINKKHPKNIRRKPQKKKRAEMPLWAKVYSVNSIGTFSGEAAAIHPQSQFQFTPFSSFFIHPLCSKHPPQIPPQPCFWCQCRTENSGNARMFLGRLHWNWRRITHPSLAKSGKLRRRARAQRKRPSFIPREGGESVVAAAPGHLAKGTAHSHSWGMDDAF
jgi:hypothetical protein